MDFKFNSVTSLLFDFKPELIKLFLNSPAPAIITAEAPISIEYLIIYKLYVFTILSSRLYIYLTSKKYNYLRKRY